MARGGRWEQFAEGEACAQDLVCRHSSTVRMEETPAVFLFYPPNSRLEDIDKIRALWAMGRVLFIHGG